MKIGIYPGSFDPVTNGHLDIIRRAAGMFDKLIVAVMANSSKKCMFTPETRREFIEKCTQNIGNVEVRVGTGLLADYAAEVGAAAIVKGLRAMSDFENEFQMALINKSINPRVETIFLVTSAENMFLSSSVIKEIGGYGADISPFIPAQILDEVTAAVTKNGFSKI